ncbi:hypothetical protein BCR41DRAFT_419915 [Lobosporangium transversale]|uniref:Uncharacterized protein n=1 Tax=Lobosporangium transversale TaxID=64571 RepID=A0A1Y2GVR8_9FUNG|nr:hypothetical protein BCR41DRAFT_419915 [Lobosporangium transversale]ORZ26396.1 hypothetical protein BCR41DRAFT_419915 [Lobosporangium transversale]|eukprot:XP_021884161.1 hypothetical protein BCR41DRAFT_419915 [Lobosporangium transversale]
MLLRRVMFPKPGLKPKDTGYILDQHIKSLTTKGNILAQALRRHLHNIQELELYSHVTEALETIVMEAEHNGEEEKEKGEEKGNEEVKKKKVVTCTRLTRIKVHTIERLGEDKFLTLLEHNPDLVELLIPSSLLTSSAAFITRFLKVLETRLPHLRVLTIGGGGILPISAAVPIISTCSDSRIKFLRLLRKLPTAAQVAVLQHCGPSLAHFVITTPLDMRVAQTIRDYCPNIQRLLSEYIHIFSEEQYHVLEGFLDACKPSTAVHMAQQQSSHKGLKTFHTMNFQDSLMDALLESHETLEDVIFMDQQVSSQQFQRVLTTCVSLRHLSTWSYNKSRPNITFRDIIGSPEWVCRNHQFLYLRISDSVNEDDLMEYGDLALRHLIGLKKLRRLKVPISVWHGVGQEEYEFIVKEWPRLNQVELTLNDTGGQTIDDFWLLGNTDHWKWFKQRRPDLKLMCANAGAVL